MFISFLFTKGLKQIQAFVESVQASNVLKYRHSPGTSPSRTTSLLSLNSVEKLVKPFLYLSPLFFLLSSVPFSSSFSYISAITSTVTVCGVSLTAPHDDRDDTTKNDREMNILSDVFVVEIR